MLTRGSAFGIASACAVACTVATDTAPVPESQASEETPEARPEVPAETPVAESRPALDPVPASAEAQPAASDPVPRASDPVNEPEDPRGPERVRALLDAGRCGADKDGLTPIACLVEGAWTQKPEECLSEISADAPLISARSQPTAVRLGVSIPPGEDDEPCREVRGAGPPQRWPIFSTGTVEFPSTSCEVGHGTGRGRPTFKIAAETVAAFTRLAAPHLEFARKGLTGKVKPAQWLRADLDADGTSDTLGVVELSHDCAGLVVHWGRAASRDEIVFVSDGCPEEENFGVEDPLFLRSGCFDLDADGRPEFTLANGPETMRGEVIMEFDGTNFVGVGVSRYFGD